MSTNMTLSPMQRDQVTREEFGEFKEEFRDFREETNDRLDYQKRYMEDGFKKVFEQADNVESTLISRIDGVENRLSTRIDDLESNLGNKIDLLNGDITWLKGSMTKVMKKIGVS